MTTTFKKRQKEMKRMEKARTKAERRFQKKLEEGSGEGGPPIEASDAFDEAYLPIETKPAPDPQP
jgi:hypothetical protein